MSRIWILHDRFQSVKLSYQTALFNLSNTNFCMICGSFRTLPLPHSGLVSCAWWHWAIQKMQIRLDWRRLARGFVSTETRAGWWRSGLSSVPLGWPSPPSTLLYSPTSALYQHNQQLNQNQIKFINAKGPSWPLTMQTSREYKAQKQLYKPTKLNTSSAQIKQIQNQIWLNWLSFISYKEKLT